MQLAQSIDNFINTLENGLHVSLQRSTSQQATVFTSLAPEFTIIIYSAAQSNRLKNPTLKTYHIDADQLLSSSEKILARLLALLGQGRTYYARQTVVARIDKKVSLDFQNEHHLQAALPGKYRYGLYYKGELVSVAIFSGGRHMRDKHPDYRSFELLRFCHKSGIRVVGGVSKLIHAFIKNFNPSDIMTYVDRDWTHASSLITLGFAERGIIPPQQYWVVGNSRHLARNEQELEELKANYPTGYLLFNSGSSKLVLTLPGIQ